MKADFGVSVVVPVYNNADILDSTIAILSAYLAQEFRDYELIFVNDGSTDGSQELLEDAALANTNIRILRQHLNIGQQQAIAIGALSAEQEIIVAIDADLPCVLDDLKKLASAAAEGTELVLGRRVGGPSRRWWRRLGSFVGAWTIRALYPQCAIRDFGCSTVAARRSFADRLRNRTDEIQVLKIQLIEVAESYVEMDIRLPEQPIAGKSGYSLLSLLDLLWKIVAYKFRR